MTCFSYLETLGSFGGWPAVFKLTKAKNLKITYFFLADTVEISILRILYNVNIPLNISPHFSQKLYTLPSCKTLSTCTPTHAGNMNINTDTRSCQPKKLGLWRKNLAAN
jgi:hypothetical protein